MKRIIKNTVIFVSHTIQLLFFIIFIIFFYYGIITKENILQGFFILIIIFIYKYGCITIENYLRKYVYQDDDNFVKIKERLFTIKYFYEKCFFLNFFFSNHYDKFVKVQRWFITKGMIGLIIVKVWEIFIYFPFARMFFLYREFVEKIKKKNNNELYELNSLIWNRIEGIFLFLFFFYFFVVKIFFLNIFFFSWFILVFFFPLFYKWGFISSDTAYPKWANLSLMRNTILYSFFGNLKKEDLKVLKIQNLEFFCVVHHIDLKKKENFFWMFHYSNFDSYDSKYINAHIISMGWYEVTEIYTCVWVEKLYSRIWFQEDLNITDSFLCDSVLNYKKILKDWFFLAWDIEKQWNVEYNPILIDSDGNFVFLFKHFSGYRFSMLVEKNKNKSIDYELEKKILNYLNKGSYDVIDAYDAYILEHYAEEYEKWRTVTTDDSLFDMKDSMEKILEKATYDIQKWRKEWETLNKK